MLERRKTLPLALREWHEQAELREVEAKIARLMWLAGAFAVVTLMALLLASGCMKYSTTACVTLTPVGDAGAE